jgi:hypothetical protein
MTNCLYDYGDSVGCAIGVALNEETLKEIHELSFNEDTTVEDLHSRGVIFVSPQNSHVLSNMQRVHDYFCDYIKPHHFDPDSYLCALRAALVTTEVLQPNTLMRDYPF